MNTNPLTTEEASKLFTEVSKAVMEGDGVALANVLSQETPEKEEQPEEETSAEEEVETSNDEAEGDTPEEEDNEQPAEEAGNEDEEEQEDDPISALKAEIATLKKELQASKSQLGRVSSLQSRLAKLDQQLRERTSSTSGQITEKVDPKIRAALKDLEDTDPALANAVAQAIKEALATVASESNAQITDTVKALRDIDYEDYLEQQKAILLSKYPNAPQVFASEHWKAWKANAPEHVRSLASSDSAEAMLLALDLYKQDMLRRYPDLAKEQEQSTHNTGKASVNEEAQRIEASRAKRKATSVDVKGGRAPTPAREPADADAIFRQAMELARKRRNGEV